MGVMVLSQKEKAKRIMRILEELYPYPEIPLNHKDHFTLLVAVLLSAQCTDERVNQITPQLFARASTPQTMAQMSIGEVEEIIRVLEAFLED